jgi:hypothetical protein
MFEAAVGTALSVIFLFMWIGFHRIARIGLIVDIGSFVGLTWMFHGTYAGMMTGVLAALFVSIFLRGLRYWFKQQRAKVAA